jgi:hypothetical protein
MANAPTRAPVTEQAFLADRMSFFSSFISTSKFAIVAVVVLMVAMRIFLV